MTRAAIVAGQRLVGKISELATLQAIVSVQNIKVHAIGQHNTYTDISNYFDCGKMRASILKKIDAEIATLESELEELEADVEATP